MVISDSVQGLLVMCLTRVGRVVSIRGGRATISYLDNKETTEVDVSMIHARKGVYLEVFANVAIARITKRDAEQRRELRRELLSRAKQANA